MISLGREWIERDSTRLAQYRTNTQPSYQDRERQRAGAWKSKGETGWSENGVYPIGFPIE